MFSYFSNHGVLGLNARNLLYIKPFNPRKVVAFADDKLKSKAYLGSRGIPVAKIYAKIEDRRQLQHFDFSALPDKCVLKPNFGYGGEGIVVLNGRNKQGQFLDTRKRPIPWERLTETIEDTLDGRFSVNGRPAIAFFEKLLVPHECFTSFRPLGLPDIRIVVFNLVPVMAMLRIPTPESGGKANTHLGGIGIGIDIAKGVTTHATQYNRIVDALPHGGTPSGHLLPFWEDMLLVASRIQQTTNIGYLAVDLTIDQEQGPVLLEVNARAGLMVQVANLAPLRSRLKRVQGVTVRSPEKGVRLAQELFGEKLPRRTDDDDRPVLGLQETLLVTGDGVHIDVPVMIAPTEERSVFTEDLLEELQEQGGVTPTGEQGLYHIKGTLGGAKWQTVVRSGVVPHPRFRALIGQRDLAGFLIDPQKRQAATPVRTQVKDDLRAMDRILARADRQLLLLPFVKPVNLREERHKAEADPSYAPLFQYKPLPEDVHEIEQRLLSLLPDTSPLGVLLDRKRRELLLRISLLRARGDARRFSEASQALFGAPTSVLITTAQAKLRAQLACDIDPGDELSAEQAANIFRDVLESYGLTDWDVVVRAGVVADCTIGGRKMYLRDGATFTRMHVDSLIAHEIETHILTAENAARQPALLFRLGCANYLDTQEGMATFNQNRVLSPHHDKRLGSSRTVLGAAFALSNGFTDLRRYLEHDLGYGSQKALGKAIELKRGLGDTAEPGAFTKGLVYARGLSAIEQFMADGGDMRRLYVGRIALEDLEIVEQVPGVQKPVLLPKWLRENGKGKGKTSEGPERSRKEKGR